MPEQAKKGDTVGIHYTGRLENGEVFDSSEGREPLEFSIGSGQVIKGFDEGVEGMSVGESKQIEIEAPEAYGERIEGLVQRVSRDDLDLGVEPEVGMDLAAQTPDGHEIHVTVTEVTPTYITLDANHPLAGKKLIFDVERVK